MFATLGGGVAALLAVQKWAAGFRRRKESLGDDHTFRLLQLPLLRKTLIVFTTMRWKADA